MTSDKVKERILDLQNKLCTEYVFKDLQGHPLHTCNDFLELCALATKQLSYFSTGACLTCHHWFNTLCLVGVNPKQNENNNCKAWAPPINHCSAHGWYWFTVYGGILINRLCPQCDNSNNPTEANWQTVYNHAVNFVFEKTKSKDTSAVTLFAMKLIQSYEAGIRTQALYTKMKELA